MWIVKIALDRPYTFIVLALLILILSPVVILSTPTDIFPSINIPVIAVAWTYSGLSPEETEGRITTVYERVLTTLVDNIEHIESTTVNGTAIVKVYLQPSASIDRANALCDRVPGRRSFAQPRRLVPCPHSSSITTRPPFRSFNLASRARTSQNPN